MKLSLELKKVFGKNAKAEKIDKIKKHRPLAYQIYNYLEKNAVGYNKRVKSNELMAKFNIDSNKKLREYIQEIRQSEVLQKIVCSEAGRTGGYWIATNQLEVEDTLNHLYKRAMEMLRTYSIIKRKSKLDGQYRIKMSDYEKELIESIMRGE